MQAGHAGFAAIARDLRATDVHPPLYFWTVAEWRRLVGNSLFAARLASVLFSVVTLGLVAMIARSVGIPAVAAVLLTVGCYGFAYTGAIARGICDGADAERGWSLHADLPRDRPLMVDRSAAGAAAAVPRHSRTIWRYSWLAPRCCWLRARRRAPAPAMSPVLPARRRLRRSGCPPICGSSWPSGKAAPASSRRSSRSPPSRRLAQYSAANLFGGLPLYVDGIARTAVTAAAGRSAGCSWSH